MIAEFGLQKPTFSYARITAFLKRNRLSFRHVHFALRGEIDPTYVKISLNQIVHVVTTYGWNGVYNVVKTSLSILFLHKFFFLFLSLFVNSFLMFLTLFVFGIIYFVFLFSELENKCLFLL